MPVLALFCHFGTRLWHPTLSRATAWPEPWPISDHVAVLLTDAPLSSRAMVLACSRLSSLVDVARRDDPSRCGHTCPAILKRFIPHAHSTEITYYLNNQQKNVCEFERTVHPAQWKTNLNPLFFLDASRQPCEVGMQVTHRYQGHIEWTSFSATNC
jgi:hypothetical protein